MQTVKKNILNILMLEDDEFDAELNKVQLLQLDEYEFLINWVNNKDEYLKALDTLEIDLVLCDYNLPQYNGIQALHDLKQRNSLIPFIFVTGAMNEETAADAIKAGAWDYVVKDRLFRLPLAVRSVLNLRDEKIITARAEEKANKLIMAIDQSSSQIIVVDIDGKIEYVNHRFTRVSGYMSDEVIGKNAFSISSDNVNLGLSIKIVEDLKSGKVFKGEINSKTKDGSPLCELVSITPIFNSSGVMTNFVFVKEDLTKRKEMETELIRARDKAEESDRLKDAFLQNMSHEIRTPLNAIIGFSELLSTFVDAQDESIKKYTTIICNSSNQLLSIVTDVLTIASIHAGQLSAVFYPVNLDKLLGNLYNIILPHASAKKLELIYDKSNNEDLVIITDETKLTQIITNLLNNAVKFTNKGEIRFGYNINENNVDIYVKDTGIGISKEHQTLIFDRFYQVDPGKIEENKGTGLGLSISMSFVKMLEGSLRVDSQPDKGSAFIISVPFEPSKTKSHQLKTSDSDVSYLSILVAGDEPVNSLFSETVLSEKHVSFFYAANGLEALNICKRNSDIDLVIMDVRMPVMDGVMALAEIHKIREKLPVIAQASFTTDQEKEQLLKRGFSDFISKPIKKEELIAIINKYLFKLDT